MCRLERGQVVVGIDLSKMDDYTPVAWVRYRSFDEFTGKLSAVAEKRCGYDMVREKSFNPAPVQDPDFRANVILDVGARIGTEKLIGHNNGQVEYMCVSYRTFNFRTAEFEGETQYNCNGGAVSATKVLGCCEGTTGMLGTNSTLALKGLVVGGFDNSKFQYMRGVHAKLSHEYAAKPYHTLVSGGKYRIESSEGKALTVVGSAQNSRALQTTSNTGLPSQIWTLEGVNDREFRLVPQSYDGFITRSAGSSLGLNVSVNSPAVDDETTVNYLQHWRLEKLVNGSYVIESVFDGKVLAGNLTLKKREGTVAEEWTVVRLDDPRALPPEQVQEYEVSSAVDKIIPALPTVCTVIDIRDSNGKPRYIDRLSLRAWNYEPLTECASAEIYLDEDEAAAPLNYCWPAENAWTPERSWNKYILAKEVKFCGRIVGHPDNAKIEQMKLEVLLPPASP